MNIILTSWFSAYFKWTLVIIYLKEAQEKQNYANMATSVEYKNWKTKFDAIVNSCPVNINACNALMNKHKYRNIYHNWAYDLESFTKAERISFNKNLDLLEAKCDKLGELDGYLNESNKVYFNYWSDKASTHDAGVFSSILEYSKTTERFYNL